VELEDPFEDLFHLLGGGVLQVNPQREALVGPHDAQGLQLEVAADELSVAEDERVDHARKDRGGPSGRGKRGPAPDPEPLCGAKGGGPERLGPLDLSGQERRRNALAGKMVKPFDRFPFPYYP
jgi:hypothetical protein